MYIYKTFFELVIINFTRKTFLEVLSITVNFHICHISNFKNFATTLIKTPGLSKKDYICLRLNIRDP